MIKVDIFVNGKFWRTAELPGIEKHFQVKIIEPDNGRTPVDVYVEEYQNGFMPVEEQHALRNNIKYNEYFANINDPELEPDPENEYCLRRIL